MPAKHALLVGINKFARPGNDLAGCVNDARDVGGVLEGRGWNTEYLLDSSATRANYTSAVARILRQCKYGDTFLTWASTHGTEIPDDDADETGHYDQAIVFHDLTYCRDDDVGTLLHQRPYGVKVQVVADLCFSGSVTRLIGDPGPAVGYQARFIPHTELTESARLSAPKRRALTRPEPLLLSGCKDTEVAYDASFGGRYNGAFTYHALKVLREQSPKTWNAWHKAIRGQLPSTEYPQSPQLSGVWWHRRGAPLEAVYT